MSSNVSRKPSIKELEQIANTVRADLEILYNADEDPEQSVETRFQASQILVAALKDEGLPAFRYSGYYKDCEDGYFDIVKRRCLYAPLDSEPFYKDISNWCHWWFVSGNYIVDITAGQFHPTCRKDYRVIVTRIGDDSYSHIKRRSKAVAPNDISR